MLLTIVVCDAISTTGWQIVSNTCQQHVQLSVRKLYSRACTAMLSHFTGMHFAFRFEVIRLCLCSQVQLIMEERRSKLITKRVSSKSHEVPNSTKCLEDFGSKQTGSHGCAICLKTNFHFV